MAVSGGASPVDMGNYESFNAKKVSSVGAGQIDSAGVAGVTPEMAQQIANALESYVSAVNGSFTAILSAVESASGGSMFQGDQINSALRTFANDIKNTAYSYVLGLKGAEQSITDAVAAAYEENDSTVAGNVNAATSTMNGF